MNSVMADDQASEGVSRLLAFRAENVRSFRDGLELPMLAMGLADEGVPRSVTWHEGGRPVQVLPAAGIFGANASGKSNVLRAMSDMRRHVLYSFSHGDPEGGMSRSAFRLDPGKEKGPSRFEVDLILHGIWHQYGFVIDDAQVLEEWAYRYPRGKAALVFRREGPDVMLGQRNRAKGARSSESFGRIPCCFPRGPPRTIQIWHPSGDGLPAICCWLRPQAVDAAGPTPRACFWTSSTTIRFSACCRPRTSESPTRESAKPTLSFSSASSVPRGSPRDERTSLKTRTPRPASSSRESY